MDFSRKFKTETKKTKLEINERAMADLMNAGWSEQDAYVMAFGSQPAYSDEWHKKKIREIVDREVFAKYIIKSKEKMEVVDDDPDTTEVKKLDKEQVMIELLRVASRLPSSDPKRADILMKYADLNQMKKDDTDVEDKTVHTYLPLTCKSCPLYLKERKKSMQTARSTM